ncbi:MAG: hypothetical protein R3280_05750 [Marinobacter sp.]|uniref:hypothetical protein n=1 Tax=Marinobacter sp. TaxID=50741 RepID=UPI00299E29ED|nr:hypothetical protein [Marinobacter sp.]MDX1634117.1 hypothetical protein [Marinobacter sp.]
MEFLCPNHRRQFSDLSSQERRDLWHFWMENAYTSSEQGQWKDVICLSGSAFDLACLDLVDGQTGMHTELTLSAILVSRVLGNQGESAGAQRVIERALESLLDTLNTAPSGDRAALESCVAVLLDASRQTDFFADYLNWPSLPFTERRRAAVYRTLH